MAIKLDGGQKVTISLAALAGALAGLWVFHGWLGTHLEVHLMTRAEAQTINDSAKRAAEAAESVAKSLDKHIHGQELKDARAKVDTLRGQISETQLWESSNGANDISRARKADLQRQLDAVLAYISCLEAFRDDCLP